LRDDVGKIVGDLLGDEQYRWIRNHEGPLRQANLATYEEHHVDGDAFRHREGGKNMTRRSVHGRRRVETVEELVRLSGPVPNELAQRAKLRFAADYSRLWSECVSGRSESRFSLMPESTRG